MIVTATWTQNLTFVGTPPSGHTVTMDADTAVGGDGNAVRPMELLAMGLAGCTGMDVISILRKKRQDVKQFEVRVDAPRAREFPQVFTRAAITYIVTGRGVEEAAVLRAIELTATKYCPAQFMFSQVFPIDLHYEIYEEDESGDRRLAHRASWQNPGEA